MGKPEMEMNAGRPPGDHNMFTGDIVVTAVARHYAISRMRADGETQEYLGVGENRAKALELACALAGAEHRVFLYASAGTSVYVPFDCATTSK